MIWEFLCTFKIICFLRNLLIEGSNIEYGKIKNCKIDTKLTSKIWRRLTSKINDGNIEFNFENIDSKTGSNGAPRGVKRGHSIPYHHQQGAPPPHGDPV